MRSTKNQKGLYCTACLLFLLTLSSCMSKIALNIEDKKINTEIENSYLNSVNEFKTSIENATSQKIDLEQEKYKIYEFDLEKIEEELEKYNLQNILHIEKKQNFTSYNFKINIDNYENLKSLIPIIDNEKVRVYLAKYNRDETREEYLDIIDYVFGEEAKEDLKKSKVEIFIYSKKALSNAKNCKIKDRHIELSFPLLDFLLLKNEISFGFDVG